MTPTILVFGGRSGEREAAIAAALTPGLATVIIAEGWDEDLAAGLAAGLTADLAAGLVAGLVDMPLAGTRPGVQLVRIAPGCLCCAGNLVLRVTLNRILRRPPAQLFISLADAAHVEALRASLSQSPYQQLLLLQPDIQAGEVNGKARRST